MAFVAKGSMKIVKSGVLLLFYLSMEYVLTTKGQIAGIQEYCFNENFEPRCNDGEVIIMTHGLFGRMRKGRCIGSNSNLGCQTNVLRNLDEMCSNKQHCNVDVANDFMSVENDCIVDMLRYLEASFKCEKVLQVQSTGCRGTDTKTMIESKLSISSEILAKSHCGSSSMEFSARAGQQLNITITDFNHLGNQNNQRSCVNYLELTESSGKTEAVCAGSYGRTGHVMSTSGHDVTAVFHIQDPRNQRFILTFEAVGCGDINPPEGTWVQREGDETTLGCHSGRHTWTLRCENNQWVGAVGSCGTAISVEKTIIRPVRKESNIALGMMVFAFFSVLLLLCSTTFSIGVCIYSKRYDKGANSSKRFQQQTLPLFAHSRQQQTSASGAQNQIRIDQQTLVDQRLYQNVDGRIEAGHPSHNNKIKQDNDQLYCNTMQSQSDSIYSDSVKYYVLENLNEPTSA